MKAASCHPFLPEDTCSGSVGSSVLVLFSRPCNVFMEELSASPKYSVSSQHVFVSHSVSQCSLTVLPTASILFLNWQRQPAKWLCRTSFSDLRVIVRMLSTVIGDTCAVPMSKYFNAANLKRHEPSIVVRAFRLRINLNKNFILCQARNVPKLSFVIKLEPRFKYWRDSRPSIESLCNILLHYFHCG